MLCYMVIAPLTRCALSMTGRRKEKSYLTIDNTRSGWELAMVTTKYFNTHLTFYT